MTSAITATIVTRFFFGNSTSFHFINLVPMPADHLGLVVLIAISAGFAGILSTTDSFTPVLSTTSPFLRTSM